MPPGNGGIDDLGGGDDGIHLRHVGVEVEFHALFRGIVVTTDSADLLDATEREEGFTVKFIDQNASENGDRKPVSDAFEPTEFFIR